MLEYLVFLGFGAVVPNKELEKHLASLFEVLAGPQPCLLYTSDAADDIGQV